MNPDQLAGLVQFASILVYALLAVWYIVPWLRKHGRADALIVLAVFHLFRYSSPYIFLAQREGYLISDSAAAEIMIGDLIGAAIALLVIIFLRRRARFGVFLSWLLVIETLIDFVLGAHQRAIEPRGSPSGVWWLILSFFAPMILVSIPLLVWQLYTRRSEALADDKQAQPNTLANQPIQEPVVP